jgi:hypothetical protein
MSAGKMPCNSGYISIQAWFEGQLHPENFLVLLLFLSCCECNQYMTLKSSHESWFENETWRLQVVPCLCTEGNFMRCSKTLWLWRRPCSSPCRESTQSPMHVLPYAWGRGHVHSWLLGADAKAGPVWRSLCWQVACCSQADKLASSCCLGGWPVCVGKGWIWEHCEESVILFQYM